MGCGASSANKYRDSPQETASDKREAPPALEASSAALDTVPNDVGEPAPGQKQAWDSSNSQWSSSFSVHGCTNIKLDKSVKQRALFSAMDTDGSGNLETDEIVPETLTMAARSIIFGTVDENRSGVIDADELLNIVMHLECDHLDRRNVNEMLRRIDHDGDGHLNFSEFIDLLKAPEPLKADERPHLVLYFDVNQTVLMTDSVTNSDAERLLNEVAANAAWGHVIERADSNDLDSMLTWELTHLQLVTKAPAEGLKSYAEFVTENRPKKDRRKLLRSFTQKGEPGEKFANAIVELRKKLLLAEHVKNADNAQLQRLGLHEEDCQLLPSFLKCIRRLKMEGRSFSLCFRTFGKDLEKISEEFNALCENRHPYFTCHPDDPEAQQAVFLDGSDGQPNMKIDCSLGSWRTGTLIREGPGNELNLVLGSREQPPLEQASSQHLSSFYQSQHHSVEIVSGIGAIRGRLSNMLHQTGRGCTLAMRDYYPAWDKSGRSAEGGKPLLVETDDPNILQVFFDDHIKANDAHIIDARQASSGKPLPMASVWGMHLVKAEPLMAIEDPQYFLTQIAEAENRWRHAFTIRRALAIAIVHYGQLYAMGKVPDVSRCGPNKYVPHAQTEDVLLSSNFNAFEDEYDNERTTSKESIKQAWL